MENVDDRNEISDSSEFVAAEDYDALLAKYEALTGPQGKDGKPE